MQKHILIAINLCLMIILVSLIIYFYPIIENEGVEPEKQYTLLLSKPYINEEKVELSPEINDSNELVDNEISNDNKFKVAFLVSNLGINNELTNKIIESFHKNIALGFSVYSENLEKNVEKASEHDVLLNLPIYQAEKPLNTALALDNHVQNEENLRRLSIFLSQGNNNYMGVYTDINQSFSFNSVITSEIMNNLREKEKILCYGGVDKLMKYTALSSHVGFTSPDLIIEYNLDKDAINDKLESISMISKFQPNILVLVEPSPIAVETLSEFLAKEHDFQIVSITDMVQHLE